MKKGQRMGSVWRRRLLARAFRDLVASRSLVSIEFGAKCLEREKDRELRERERESCDRAL